MAAVPRGAAAVVVTTGGLPIVLVGNGPVMTVASNGLGVAVTIVAANGAPMTLLNEDGSAYTP